MKEAVIRLGTLQELAVAALRECCHKPCGMRHIWTEEEVEKVDEFMRRRAENDGSD